MKTKEPFDTTIFFLFLINKKFTITTTSHENARPNGYTIFFFCFCFFTYLIMMNIYIYLYQGGKRREWMVIFHYNNNNNNNKNNSSLFNLYFKAN